MADDGVGLINPPPPDHEQEEEEAADADQNFLPRPIPFAIRNWVFGTALGVLLLLIQIAYQESKGALILFDTKYGVNMDLMISAFIFFLSATVAEKTISCFGGYSEYCLTTTSWKRVFGHVADVLATSIIGLLTSVLPSSIKVARYITYIVCAGPILRLFVIFLVIPLVKFIVYKYYSCFYDIVDASGNDGGAVGGDDGDGGGKDGDDVGGGPVGGDDGDGGGAVDGDDGDGVVGGDNVSGGALIEMSSPNLWNSNLNPPHDLTEI